MEVLRWARNPWGQNVLLGVSWWLIWAAVAASVLFVVGHAVWAAKWAPNDVWDDRGGKSPVAPNAKVLRHTLAARLFHWCMAASMLVLLVTAFFPIVGIRFPWVTVHWAAGLVLTAAILYHIIHSVFWQDFWAMWPNRADIRDAIRRGKLFLGRAGPLPAKPGKYPFENKMFHLANVGAGLGMIATGLLMMVRVETPFWTRNPYLLADDTWGLVYVIHGACAVLFITMVAAHIYFAIRPDKWWLTLSMIRGWITGREYVTHHDPALWVAETTGGTLPPTEEQPVAVGAGAGDRGALV